MKPMATITLTSILADDRRTYRPHMAVWEGESKLFLVATHLYRQMVGFFPFSFIPIGYSWRERAIICYRLDMISMPNSAPCR